MEFIVVVFSLLIIYMAGSLPSLQRDGWYARWVAGLRNNTKLDKWPFVSLLISILLPVIAVALLVTVVTNTMFGLPWLILNVVFLLYAFGRGDLGEQLDTYLFALGRGDLQGAYRNAAVFNLNHKQGLAENLDDLQHETLAAIPYRYFEHYFAVIFWYALLGAPGAILYRLSELHTDMELDKEQEKPLAQRWLLLLEWLPVRLLGITLAVVGNFSGAASSWRKNVLNTQKSTSDILEGFVEGALKSDLDNETSSESDALWVAKFNALKTLFLRALIFTIIVIAVLVIFL